MKKIGVLTSGGDSPGMNAAIRAVTRTGIKRGLRVYGIRKGYLGLIKGDMTELLPHSVSEIVNRGGTFLGSARCDEFRTEAGIKQAISQLHYHDIEGLVVIGGDGSLRGAHELAKLGVKVLGLPGTIDNDLHGSFASIGYDTAMNTIINAINNLRDTASAHNRIFIVETMGRGSGWLALNSAIAGGADIVLIPEVEWKIEDVVEEVKRGHALGKSFTMIVVAEGAIEGIKLLEMLKQHIGDKDIRVSVLGHIQRGGSPSAYDRLLASRLGSAAVDFMLEGRTDALVGISKNAVSTTPLEEVFGHSRSIDAKLFELAQLIAF